MISRENYMNDPFADYIREFEELMYQRKREYQKMAKELEKPFREFEELMRKYDRLFVNPDDTDEDIDEATHYGRETEPQHRREYSRPREDKEAPGEKGWWTVHTETLTFPEELLQYLSVLKELRDEMSSEDEFKRKH